MYVEALIRARLIRLIQQRPFHVAQFIITSVLKGCRRDCIPLAAPSFAPREVEIIKSDDVGI